MLNCNGYFCFPASADGVSALYFPTVTGDRSFMSLNGLPALSATVGLKILFVRCMDVPDDYDHG